MLGGTNLAQVINEHEDCVTKNLHKGKLKVPYQDVQDQCFVAATRSRTREASEKVPDIFPLQGEHRKPEHAHKPRKDKTLNQPVIIQPVNNVAGVVDAQIPQDIPLNIDVNQDIGMNQLPTQGQKVEVMKELDPFNYQSLHLIK